MTVTDVARQPSLLGFPPTIKQDLLKVADLRCLSAQVSVWGQVEPLAR